MRLGFIGKSALQISFLFTVFTFASGNARAQEDGKALFTVNCASCHAPDKVVTGPALRDVRAKWADGAGDEQLIYTWVRSYKKAMEQSPYAVSVSKSMPTDMNEFPDLTDAQIDAIFDYVDTSPPPGTSVAGGDGAGAVTEGGEEGGISTWWYVIGGILLVVIFAAASTRRQLVILEKEKNSEPVDEQETYVDIFRNWARRHQGPVAAITVVVFFALSIVTYGWLKDVGVVSGYHPSQPISGFSHQIHAGINKIDCQYCHSSASKSKHAGLPTVNVCLNCHKAVDGVSEEGVKGVAMVREAAGFNPATGTFSGETKPIVWNKVHVLPDHVYFNHAQHVTVGGLDCKNCHGDVASVKTAHVANVEDLEPVGGLADNKLTKPTLTMGWCIECHGNAEVGLQGNGAYYEEIHRRLVKRKDVYKKYLDDEKITVRELGGWECSKCHY